MRIINETLLLLLMLGIWLNPILLSSMPMPRIIIPVDVTAYAPLKSQTDSTPFITASNTRVRTGICALSQDIEQGLKLKFGDIIHIKNIGAFEFQDRMNKRWKKRVDIFFWKNSDAIKFGIKKSEMTFKRRM